MRRVSPWRARWLARGLGALLLLGAAAPARRLDRVVAVVDRDVITASQMMREVRVALAWRVGGRAAMASLGPARDGRAVLSSHERQQVALFAALEDYIVEQVLIAGQVRRQGIEDVSDEDLTRRLEKFRGRFESLAAYHDFLHTFGIKPAQLGHILRRDLHNERFVQSRLRVGMARTSAPPGSAEPPPARDVEAPPEGDAEAPGAAVDVASPGRSDRALQAWLAQLKQHVEIRRMSAGGALELQQRP